MRAVKCLLLTEVVFVPAFTAAFIASEQMSKEHIGDMYFYNFCMTMTSVIRVKSLSAIGAALLAAIGMSVLLKVILYALMLHSIWRMRTYRRHESSSCEKVR